MVGVITLATTSAEAARQNALLMDKVGAAVKAKLTEKDHLRSVGYRLYPQTQWDQATRRSRRVGYEASNRLEITSGDPQALGAILDAAVAAGANSVSGPAWSLADPAAARRQVQVLALADARAQAEALAQAAGLRLGGILALEVDGATAPRLAPAPAMARAGAGAPPPPETSLEPGMIMVQASVRCLFALSPQP
ncbi:MAG: SIMPL domain-containing protein [Pseudomonadota bacterium]